jgi:Ca-activated chloride channel family protein
MPDALTVSREADILTITLARPEAGNRLSNEMAARMADALDAAGPARLVVLRAQGMSMRVRLDETVLKKVAEITEGNYYRAIDAQQLLEVYRQLGTTIRLEKHQLTEVTAVLLALAMLLVLCGSLINLRRHARVL